MNRAWEDEPDELDWQDEKTGLSCRIVRCKWSGHLCGYVQIPEGHPLCGVEYNAELPESLKALSDVTLAGTIGKREMVSALLICIRDRALCGDIFDVHGSVTFSGKLSNREGFWYGFDCAHAGDFMPKDLYASEGTYRDMEFVKAECASLAAQIVQVSS